MDLSPVLTGKGKLKRNAIYWHYPHYNQHPESFPSGVVRAGNWKLIENYETGKLQLFDLKNDLSERKNLVNELPEKAKSLRSMLLRWQEDVGADPMKINPEYQAN